MLTRGIVLKFNRIFLNDNNIAESIMRKNLINAKLTDFEIQRNKLIFKSTLQDRAVLWPD